MDDQDTTFRETNENVPEKKKVRIFILVAYGIVALIWCLLTHFLGLAPWTKSARDHGLSGVLGAIVFVLPLIVIALSMAVVGTAPSLCGLQNGVKNSNLLTLGILIAIPLFSLLDSSYTGDRTQFALVILSAMAIAVLCQVDVWSTRGWTCVIHHVESGLKTLSIGLLVYVIALYACKGKYIHYGKGGKTEEAVRDPNIK